MMAPLLPTAEMVSKLTGGVGNEGREGERAGRREGEGSLFRSKAGEGL